VQPFSFAEDQWPINGRKLTIRPVLQKGLHRADNFLVIVTPNSPDPTKHILVRLHAEIVD